MKTYPWETIRARVRTLVRVTPTPLRRFLIAEMAAALSETALTLPSAGRSLCICGRRLHPNSRQGEVELTELDFSTGYQSAGIERGEDAQPMAWAVTERNDQHSVGFMCPDCGRLYRMPTHIELTYA